MHELDSVLIDTSTLLNLRLDSFKFPSEWRRTDTGAVEALVLFDHVLLDAPSVGDPAESPLALRRDSRPWMARRRLHEFLSMEDLGDSVRYVNRDPAEVKEVYRRALTLVEGIDWSPDTADLLGFHVDQDHAIEVGVEVFPSSDWSEVARQLGDDDLLRQIVSVFDDKMDRMLPLRAGGLLMLIRLFYYLATQERLGGPSLLLHASKSISQPGDYGYARTILDIFDERVRGAYLDRKQRWLGGHEAALPVPALARYVCREAQRRGWSLGRTIAWLRTRPEVNAFRKGMKELAARVGANDDAKIDAVLSELESAAVEWSKQLGAKIHQKKFSLQVALPFVQPTFDLPLPLPAHTPAQRLLVLIDIMMRSN